MASKKKQARGKQKSKSTKAARGHCPARGKRYTPEQRQHALLLLESGIKKSEVAKSVGTTEESLRRWEKKGPVPTVPSASPAVSEVAAGQGVGATSAVPSPYRPKDPGQGLSEAEQTAILGCKKKHPSMGPAQIRAQLKRFKGWRLSTKAIARVLKAHGYEPVHVRGRPQGPEPIRFEAPRPNALWQADFAELRVGAQRRYVLLVLDDFSRFCVGHVLCESPSAEVSVELLSKASARYGRPESVRTDRGGGFLAAEFTKYLEAELIDHIVGRSYHPEGGGKVESLVGTLRRELWDTEHFDDWPMAERRLANWIAHYNASRAHMGIDGLTPADRYFGRADEVLSHIDAVSRRRNGAHAQRADEGAAFEEVSRGGPMEVLRLVIVDGHMELRLCGAIVHRYCSPWLALPLAQAARAQRVSPERVSRLATRAVVTFDPIVATFTRRGRPPGDPATDAQATELALYKALLDVATSILRRLNARTRWLRPLVVGAWLQLRDTHPQLTQERFCQVLGQSPRTLRQWLREPPRSESPQPLDPAPTKPPPNKPRTRGPRRPRFGFDTVLPDTQYATDTTDLRAFGVPLKLIAAQNVGGRDTDLLDSVLVDDHESAEHVVTVLAEALAGKPGAQLLTDQGTPYMSERVRAWLEQAEAEHAPQCEGDPQGKATIERAFGSAKDLARPLLRLTDALADKLPVLRQPDLARAASRLVLAAVLRAYQAGARACRRAEQQRGELSEQQLAQAAERQRDDARATERSKRLLLTHLHALYDFARPIQRFVRDLRRYPLEVLQDADRAFRSQAHRDDIRDRASYFGAIVRTCFDASRTERARIEHERLQRHQRARGDALVHAQQRAWRTDPIQWLRDALDGLAAQWMPATGALFADGQGAALAWLEKSLELIAQQPAPRPIALGVLYDFRRANLDRIGPQGLDAIEKILLRELDRTAPILDPTLHYTVRDDAAIMRIPGLQRHPGPDLSLRI